MPKGQKKPTDDALKKQCKTEYDTLKREVMQFLIQAEWVQQEAADQDIKVTDKEIKKSFEDQKKQAFPNDKQYEEFLASSGMTEDDILFRVKLDQLQQKLTQKVTEDAKKVSDEDISAYYEKNKKRFAQPERRDLRVVLTKTEAKANQAKKALESGQSFKKVVKQYSIDEASKSQGGLLPAVSEGQQEKAFDAAIFDAEKGKIEGPVKTQFGWYVFEVEKVTEGVAADARPVQGDDQEPAALPAPAEGARRVHQVLPRGLQGRDRLRGRLPRGRVQERSEGRDRHRPRLRRQPGRPAAAAGTAADADAHAGDPAAALVSSDLSAALERLDEITRRLRRECPWDREQDERSIVPHTVEEAYELADAAHSGDDAKLLDELGDVLFQVYFLSLLLEERGQGSLAEVAEHCREKLIRRHPHVFGDRAADTAGDVVRNWNQIKRDDERGGEIFGEIPETLPSTLYAKKILKRAADAGARASSPARPPAGRGQGRRGSRARIPSSRCAGRQTSTDNRWRQSERHREGPRTSDPRLAREPRPSRSTSS